MYPAASAPGRTRGTPRPVPSVQPATHVCHAGQRQLPGRRSGAHPGLAWRGGSERHGARPVLSDSITARSLYRGGQHAGSNPAANGAGRRSPDAVEFLLALRAAFEPRYWFSLIMLQAIDFKLDRRGEMHLNSQYLPP
jgi:hypothetical protein